MSTAAFSPAAAPPSFFPASHSSSSLQSSPPPPLAARSADFDDSNGADAQQSAAEAEEAFEEEADEATSTRPSQLYPPHFQPSDHRQQPHTQASSGFAGAASAFSAYPSHPHQQPGPPSRFLPHFALHPSQAHQLHPSHLLHSHASPPHAHASSSPASSLASFQSGFSSSVPPPHLHFGSAVLPGGAGAGGGGSATTCRLFASGYCKWGAACRFLHIDLSSSSPTSASPQQPQMRGMDAPPGLSSPAGHQQQLHPALFQQQMQLQVMQQQQQQRSPPYTTTLAQQHHHPQSIAFHSHTAGVGGMQQQQQHSQPQSDTREGAEVGREEEGDEGANGAGLQHTAHGAPDAAVRFPAGLRAERGDAEDRGAGGDAAENGGADESSTSTSTPTSSSGPSSVASTALSSSASSPSTLSARAIPFSSSFSSPASPSFFQPSPASSHTPYLPSLHSHYPPPFYPKPFPHSPASSSSSSPAYFHPSAPPPSFPSFAQPHPQPPHLHHSHHPQLQPPPASSSSSPPSPLARDVDGEPESADDGSLSSTAINFDQYDRIDVDVQGVELPPAIASFDELSFPPSLQHCIHIARFSRPTPVQKHALPIALQGRDIMACAQTGSGKCWARGTRLRLYSGGVKEVECFEGGELLMGDDGLPRVATKGSLSRGRAEMFAISPHWEGAQAFTVNGAHILVVAVDAPPTVVEKGAGRWAVENFAVSASLGLHQRSVPFHSRAAALKEAARQAAAWKPLELQLSVDDFLDLNPSLQSACQLMASAAVTFQSDALRLDALLSSIVGRVPSTAQLHTTAWYLGLLLARRHSSGEQSADAAWKRSQLAINERLAVLGRLWPGLGEPSSAAFPCISFTRTAPSGCADVSCVGCRLMLEYGLLDGVSAELSVPHGWLCESLDVRRHLLAGLIDGCGQVNDWSGCELTAAEPAVAMGYKTLAASMGVRNGAVQPSPGLGFRVRLSGDLCSALQLCASSPAGPPPACDELALLASRRYGFSVRSCGVDDYFGFAVHGGANRRLLLADYTVTHNTAAFLFPLISMLLHSGLGAGGVSGLLGYGKQRRYAPSGLILAPTRELASQIGEEAVKFCSGSSLHAVVVYGGQDIRQQFRELDRGCDILVATPGRLMDFLERGRVSLSQVGYLVFDEADRMLDMGFEPQIRQIVHGHDMHEQRQTLMFSATFPREIQRLAADFLQHYAFIAVGRVGSSSDLIVQQLEYVEEEDKQAALMRQLPRCKGLTLIFVERKRTADLLESFLSRQRLAVTSIHGDRSQHERETALAHFRASRCPILVATDVAARGLDIPHVLDVINYDMPATIEDYVHRIGRTGRCGRTGTATSFLNRSSQGVVRELHDMLLENKQEIPHWLEEWWRESRGGGGGRGGRGRGRGGWGARDFRQGQFGSGRGGGRGANRGSFGRGGMRGFGGLAMAGSHGMGGEQGMGMAMGLPFHEAVVMGSMHSNGLMMMGGGPGGRGAAPMMGGSAELGRGGAPPSAAPPLGYTGGGGGGGGAHRGFALHAPHEAWGNSG